MTLLVWAVGLFGAGLVAWYALLLAAYVNVPMAGALALAAGGGAMLVMAAVQGRREHEAVRLRHCLECGASVEDEAGFCPRCHGVRLEEVGSAGAGGGTGGRRAGREMPVSAYSPDSSGAIGWVDAAPPGSWGEGSISTKSLRRWGLALSGVALVLALIGGYGAML